MEEETKLSNCCAEPFIEESDVCSRCKEHAGYIDPEDVDL